MKKYGNVTYTIYGVLRFAFNFLAGGSAVVWTNMPAALTEFLGTTINRVALNMIGASEVRFIVNVATAGSANAKLRMQYSTNQTTWYYMDQQDGGGTGFPFTTFCCFCDHSKVKVLVLFMDASSFCRRSISSCNSSIWLSKVETLFCSESLSASKEFIWVSRSEMLLPSLEISM